ncbi:hypothetical protein CM240_0766 [Clostridium bornimense]|uniref:ribonucleoside-diphosphate reductase n=1 Tax=Clostridium bornimense TaxID=1216932 RepID=W6RTK7_9CLOT|nr:TIGR03905 family TSCPD domain-containing protein [Clostridium bornimense]CDM67931.1 hypothetical protein CM240_0766 [Clostridium bornimense]
MYTYKTSGVCSSEIKFDIKDNKVKEVLFVGGCPGNALGLSSLLKDMNINEAIEKLSGIKCGKKSTSCPDQLAKALTSVLSTIE